MRHKLGSIVLSILMMGIFLTPSAYAQGVKYMTIKIEKQIQVPKTKMLPVKTTITSQVDSDRLDILAIPDSGISIEGDKLVSVSVKKGQSIEKVYNIKPLTPGQHELKIKAQAWQPGENLVSTESIVLTFADDLQIQPQTDEYKAIANRDRVLSLLCYSSIGIAIAVALGIAYLKFKSWYESEET